MATLYCSPPLVKFTDGTAELHAPGATLAEVLAYAEQTWPGLGVAVSDGTRPRAGVMVFVDGREVRDLASAQALHEQSRVELVTIAYGG